jgi:hypothetical protein
MSIDFSLEKVFLFLLFAKKVYLTFKMLKEISHQGSSINYVTLRQGRVSKILWRRNSTEALVLKSVKIFKNVWRHLWMTPYFRLDLDFRLEGGYIHKTSYRGWRTSEDITLHSCFLFFVSELGHRHTRYFFAQYCNKKKLWYLTFLATDF